MFEQEPYWVGLSADEVDAIERGWAEEDAGELSEMKAAVAATSNVAIVTAW
jgi:hypothetical protein